MSLLRISTVQADLAWEDKDSNLRHLAEMIGPLHGKTDLIILPEMFSTGFSMNTGSFGEPMDGQAVTWMLKTANELDAAITGSLIIKSDGFFYNRMVFARPDGTFDWYDKRHLFTMAGEESHYKAGKIKKIVTWKDWKICLQVCYDLRFPAWSRNLEDYDLLIYVANWPEKRSYAWKSLLQARAIENQCFVAGVNRVGTDGPGNYHSGDSCIFGPMGDIPLYMKSNEEEVFTLTIDRLEIQKTRSQLPFLADRDDVTVDG